MKKERTSFQRVVQVGLLAFVCLLVGWGTSQIKAEASYGDLMAAYHSTLEEAETVRNHNRTLEGAIGTMDTENNDLKSLIAELEVRPAEIKYITRTETIIKPSEPEVILPALPEEYLFTLEDDLVVGKFSKEEWGYMFNTYGLHYRQTMIVSDKKTSSSLQVASDYEKDVWHEIPIDVEVSRIKERKFFEPNLGIGIMASAPTFDITGSLWLSMLHPLDGLDVLSVKVGGNNQVAHAGVDLIGYNVGNNLPVLTDTWVFLGGSLNTNLEPQIDLTVGSKF